MIWIILAIIFIAVLAWGMRKATKGTPFENDCPCAPNVDHLRWLEKGEKREDAKRENMW